MNSTIEARGWMDTAKYFSRGRFTIEGAKKYVNDLYDAGVRRVEVEIEPTNPFFSNTLIIHSKKMPDNILYLLMVGKPDTFIIKERGIFVLGWK